MDIKKYFVLSAACVYAITLAMFLMSKRDKPLKLDGPDVGKDFTRFCCKDESRCDQSYIEKNFDPKLFFDSISDKTKIQPYFNKPSCPLVETNCEEKLRLYSVYF